ncbi:MAG: DUF3137 domain-containing protein [Candidatus Paceibacterota bacterium]
MKKEAFNEVWIQKLRPALVALGELRLKEREAIIYGSTLAAIGIAIPILFPLKFLIGILIALVFGGLGVSVYLHLHPKRFKELYKTRVINTLLKETHYDWSHVPDAENADDIFKSSGLYNLKNSTSVVDDMFKASKEGVNLYAVETRVDMREGKKTRVVFGGLAFRFDLGKEFRGQTYIISEKEKRFYRAVGTHEVRGMGSDLGSTELEWNDFERLLHVETTDEREVREILTPDFMLDLYEWWSEHGKFVRLSFKESHMYMVLPIRHTLFEPTVFGSIDKEKEILWSYLDAFLLAEKLLERIEYIYRYTVEG